MHNSPIPFQPGASVVAYLRDSGGEDQDLSTSEQQNALQEWCDAQKLHLSRVFRDEARPGSSVVNRTAFNAMMTHFHDPACTDRGVIIWKYSRFSRDFDDAQFFKADLRRRGFVIYSINDAIPDSLEGKVFETMIDWMNHRYLDDLSTDIKRGLHHIVKEYGAMPGHPPPGFKRETRTIGTRRDGSPHTISRWVIDPESAPLIRAAWQMRAEGASIRSIDQQFHLFKTRSMYTYFFRNQLYIGTLVYGGTVIKEYSEPLIDPSTWDAVQALNTLNATENNPTRAGNPNNPRRLGSSFLLSGLLHCSKCGALMNGQVIQFGGKKRNDYYQCSHAAAQMDCDARRIPRAPLEGAIINQVIEFVQNPSLLAEREKKRVERAAAKIEETSANVKSLEKEIAGTQKRIASLINRLADDAHAPQSIVDTIRQLERSVTEKQGEIDRLRSSPLPAVLPRDPEYIRELSAKMIEVLLSDDTPRKRTFLKLLISRVDTHLDVEGSNAFIRGVTWYYSEEDYSYGSVLSRDTTRTNKLYSLSWNVQIR